MTEKEKFQELNDKILSLLTKYPELLGSYSSGTVIPPFLFDYITTISDQKSFKLNILNEKLLDILEQMEPFIKQAKLNLIK